MLSRYRMELAMAGVVFALGALALAGALEHETGWAEGGPQAGFFPFRLGLIIMAVSTLVAGQAWWNREGLRRDAVVTREGGRRVVMFAVPILVFVAAAQWIGLYVATAIYLAVILRWQGGRTWFGAVGVALCFTVGAYVVFERWFLVPLLKGPVEAWLGFA